MYGTDDEGEGKTDDVPEEKKTFDTAETVRFLIFFFTLVCVCLRSACSCLLARLLWKDFLVFLAS